MTMGPNGIRHLGGVRHHLRKLVVGEDPVPSVGLDRCRNTAGLGHLNVTASMSQRKKILTHQGVVGF